jgi:hypothetical protein
MVHVVISNFNTDPRYLIDIASSFTLYDQSSDDRIIEIVRDLKNKSSTTYFVQNPGHNLINTLDYIIDNYHHLPEKIAFVKGNIVPRHCSLEYLKQTFSKGHYSYLWYEPNVRNREGVQMVLQPGHFLEINTSWYVWDSPHRYFTSLNKFLGFLFQDYTESPYLQFAPGGNYLVESNRIRNNPLVLYQVLKEIVGYTWRPAEAFMLERSLPLIFNRTNDLQPYFSDYQSAMSELQKLPDISLHKREKKDPSLVDRVRWKLIEMLGSNKK